VALSALSPLFSRAAGVEFLVASVSPLTAGMWVGAVLCVGLGLRYRKKLRWVGFPLLAAYLTVLPLVVMEENGRALTEEMLLHSPRYLLAPMLFGCWLVPMALDGLKKVWVGPVALVLLLGLCTYHTVSAVHRLSKPVSLGAAVADAVLHGDLDSTVPLDVYTNTYDDSTVRFLLSRWVAEQRAPIRIVQRGSWDTIVREPSPTIPMDFGDSYIALHSASGWPSAEGAKVLLTSVRPSVTEILPVGEQEVIGKAGLPRLFRGHWGVVESAVQMGVVFSEGVVQFRMDYRPDDPSGRSHQPKIISGDLRLEPLEVYGFRVHYRATGCERQTNDRQHEYPYLEFHWEANGQSPEDTFVSLPVVADGLHRSVDAILIRDPIWRQSRRIKRVGIWPLNDAGEFELLRVELIPVARAVETAGLY